jgi:hypothetical protein
MYGSSIPEPPPFDPSGVYDVQVEAEGAVLSAVMTLTATPDEVVGSMDMAELGSGVPLADISIADPQVTFWVNAPDGDYFVSLTFEGEKFTGTFESDVMGGYISGTKRR